MGVCCPYLYASPISHVFCSFTSCMSVCETAPVLVVTQQGLFNYMQIGKMKVQGEDVTDPDVLKAVETAVRRNTSLKRIKIDGSYLKWANVATAILKGAAQTQSLRRLELMTPEDFPPHQEVVDDVRRANPKLQLVVWALGESASHDTT